MDRLELIILLFLYDEGGNGLSFSSIFSKIEKCLKPHEFASWRNEIENLQREKLIKKKRTTYTITEKGMMALEKDFLICLAEKVLFK